MKSNPIILVLLPMLFLWSCGQENSTDKGVGPDGLPLPDGAYKEKHRPQLHFSPPEKWMNDPNGMVYYDGEYHLFYQHNPNASVWGPMHWGHAVSEDLVHWTNLPIGLYPDELGMIFSGSVVVDKSNSSGFKNGEEDVMVAIFTHHNMDMEKAGNSDLFQYQSIAYSNDRGRTWTKYEGNPVIKNPGIRDFRDPKVFWHEPSKQWVMILACLDRVRIYNSPNLKEWAPASEFGAEWGAHGGVWECPDLFQLDVNGNPMDKKWMMIVSINPGGPNGGSATQYFVGDFDGEVFTLDKSFANSLMSAGAFVPEGLVFDDFERLLYKNWKREGKAFLLGPAKGALNNQQEVSGFSGKRLTNSFGKSNGDEAKGKLISEPFTIEKNFINFQIGGGKIPGKVCMNLVVADTIAATATGNDSENLKWTHWDVSDFIGQQAHLEIVDDWSEEWGHIMVDQIMFADEGARSNVENAAWLDYGKDNYAGVTWSNVPPRDGRSLFIGWMSNWQYANKVPTETWRSAMTLPREIELVRQGGVVRALSHPLYEFEELRKGDDPVKIEPRTITSVINALADIRMDTPLVELTLQLEVEEGARGGILLHSAETKENLEIGFDAKTMEIYVDRGSSGATDFSPDFAAERHVAPYDPGKKPIKLHIFVDVASVEIFVGDGSVVMTEIFFPTEEFDKISFFSREGSATISGEAWMLDPIW